MEIELKFEEVFPGRKVLRLRYQGEMQYEAQSRSFHVSGADDTEVALFLRDMADDFYRMTLKNADGD